MAANTYSLQFTGANYASKLSPTGLYGKSVYTIESWFYITSTGSDVEDNKIISVGTRASATEVVASLNVTNGNKLRGYLGIGGTDNAIVGSTTLSTGTWYHGACTYDGANIRLYLGTVGADDASDATAVAKAGTMNTPGASHDVITMGASGFTSETVFNDYLVGYVDEARIWNEARSLASINADRKSQLTGSETNLLALFRNNNGSGSTVTDAKGVNNLTTSGSPTWSTTVPFADYTGGEQSGFIFITS